VECAPGEGKRKRGRNGEGGTPALIREQTKDTIIIFIDGRGSGGPQAGGEERMSMYGIFISGGILRP